MRSVRLGELRQNEFDLPGDAEPLPEPSDSMRLTERAPALPPSVQPPRLDRPTGGSLFALLRRSYEGSRRSVMGSP